MSDIERPSPRTEGGTPTVEIPAAEPTVDIPRAGAYTPPPEPTIAIPAPAASPISSPWVIFLVVAALGLLIGIALSALTRESPGGQVVARGVVGPSGGTLAFDGKGRLVVPKGALRSPKTIEVRRAVVGERLRVQPPEGPLYVFEPNGLIAYTFTPAELDFAKPVKIVLPLKQTRRNGTAFSSVNGAVLFLGGEVDERQGTITLEVLDLEFRTGTAGVGADV